MGWSEVHPEGKLFHPNKISILLMHEPQLSFEKEMRSTQWGCCSAHILVWVAKGAATMVEEQTLMGSAEVPLEGKVFNSNLKFYFYILR